MESLRERFLHFSCVKMAMCPKILDKDSEREISTMNFQLFLYSIMYLFSHHFSGTSSIPPSSPPLLVVDSSLVKSAFDRKLDTPIEFLTILRSPVLVD